MLYSAVDGDRGGRLFILVLFSISSKYFAYFSNFLDNDDPFLTRKLFHESSKFYRAFVSCAWIQCYPETRYKSDKPFS